RKSTIWRFRLKVLRRGEVATLLPLPSTVACPASALLPPRRLPPFPTPSNGPAQAASCSRRRSGRAFLQRVDVERARTQPAETLLAAGLLGAEEDNASPLPSGTIAAFPGDAGHTIRRCRTRRLFMRIALLAGGDGWHVRDRPRAAAQLGHTAEPVDFRRVRAH